MSAWTWNTSVERRVESLLPLGRRRRTRVDLNQFGTHPDSTWATRRLFPPHSGGEQVFGTQFARNLLGRLGAVPVLVGAGPRDDRERRNLRKASPHLVGDPVGEVGIGRVAEVLEGQHRHDPRPTRLRAALVMPPSEQHTQSDQDAEHRGWLQRPGWIAVDGGVGVQGTDPLGLVSEWSKTGSAWSQLIHRAEPVGCHRSQGLADRFIHPSRD